MAFGSGSHGDATVTGAGSTWTNTGALEVGEDGDGTLSIQAGAQVSNATGVAGANAGSTGSVTVKGVGAAWTNSGDADIGVFGAGALLIQAGGSVSDVRGQIGIATGSFGTVIVTGAGSTWTNSNLVSVGNNGTGSLTIAAGGHVSSGNGFVGIGSGSNGEADLAGAGSTWTIGQKLTVGGGIFGLLDIKAGGVVSVAEDTILMPGGAIKLEGGEFGTSAISFQGGGRFLWTSGTLHVGTYHGDLTTPNGGLLAPGTSAGSTLILGNYMQQTDGAVEIEIGGLGQGTQFDFVNVTGTALIDGELRLKLINGFHPTSSQTFLIFNAASLLGIFNNAGNGQRVTTSDNVSSFLVHYGPGSPFNPNQVILSDFERTFLHGDFNHDGQVTAADIPTMLTALTDLNSYASTNWLSATQLAAIGDFDASGTVTNRDIQGLLDLVISLGGGSTITVPEPASWALIVFGGLCVLALRRRNC